MGTPFNSNPQNFSQQNAEASRRAVLNQQAYEASRKGGGGAGAFFGGVLAVALLIVFALAAISLFGL